MNQVNESSSTFTLPDDAAGRVWKGVEEEKKEKWTFPVKIIRRHKNSTDAPTPPGIHFVGDMKIEREATDIMNYSTGYFRIYNLNPKILIIREFHHAIYLSNWGYIHNEVWRNQAVWGYQKSKPYSFKFRNISKVNSDVWFISTGYDKQNYSTKSVFYCDIQPEDGQHELIISLDTTDKEFQILRPFSPICRAELGVNLKIQIGVD